MSNVGKEVDWRGIWFLRCGQFAHVKRFEAKKNLWIGNLILEFGDGPLRWWDTKGDCPISHEYDLMKRKVGQETFVKGEKLPIKWPTVSEDIESVPPPQP